MRDGHFSLCKVHHKSKNFSLHLRTREREGPRAATHGSRLNFGVTNLIMTRHDVIKT